MFGGREKAISECANCEIRAFLVVGSIIVSGICAATFWNPGPDYFYWFVRLYGFVWLVRLWSALSGNFVSADSTFLHDQSRLSIIGSLGFQLNLPNPPRHPTARRPQIECNIVTRRGCAQTFP
jgi:hypothetical protein